MVIRNRFAAFIYRIALLAFLIFACFILFTSDATGGDIFNSARYFATLACLYSIIIVFSEVIANAIGLSKGAEGLAPGVYSPLFFAALVYEIGDAICYPLYCYYLNVSYFTAGRTEYVVLAHIIIAVGMTLDWLLFGEKGTVKWRHALYCLLPPVFYFGLSLISHCTLNESAFACGIFDPSSFLNNPTLPTWFADNGGWNGVLITSLSMLALLGATACLLIFLNDLLAGRYFKKGNP